MNLVWFPSIYTVGGWVGTHGSFLASFQEAPLCGAYVGIGVCVCLPTPVWIIMYNYIKCITIVKMDYVYWV